MEKIGESRSGTIYLADGTVNVARLNRKGRPLGWGGGEDEFYGIDRFRMWVCDAADGAIPE